MSCFFLLFDQLDVYKLELAMRLREYAVHADYAHIRGYVHAGAAQNPLPHEPRKKAKVEEFWRLERRQELEM